MEIEKENTDRGNSETEIIRIDTEVGSLLDKLSLANDALFNYINKRAEELHRLLYNQKTVDTKPLSEPLEVWDSLTAQEKNNIAKKVIDVIFVSDETGIDIRFSI